MAKEAVEPEKNIRPVRSAMIMIPVFRILVLSG
jgi:hypothetical protein